MSDARDDIRLKVNKASQPVINGDDDEEVGNGLVSQQWISHQISHE